MMCKKLLTYDHKIFKCQTGISPDSMQECEQGENAEEERKAVRKKLVTCYETNISTRLKTDLCDLDVCNYNHAKEGLTSKNLL